MQNNHLPSDGKEEDKNFNDLPSPIKQFIIEKAWIENIENISLLPEKNIEELALDPFFNLYEIEKQLDCSNSEQMKTFSLQMTNLALINKSFSQASKILKPKFSSIAKQKLQLVKIRFLVKKFLTPTIQNNHDENLREYLHHFIFLLKPIEGLNRLSCITEPEKINKYLTAWIKNAKIFYLITQNVLHKKREGTVS